jgi:hypothetical protein
VKIDGVCAFFGGRNNENLWLGQNAKMPKLSFEAKQGYCVIDADPSIEAFAPVCFTLLSAPVSLPGIVKKSNISIGLLSRLNKVETEMPECQNLFWCNEHYWQPQEEVERRQQESAVGWETGC